MAAASQYFLFEFGHYVLHFDVDGEEVDELEEAYEGIARQIKATLANLCTEALYNADCVMIKTSQPTEPAEVERIFSSLMKRLYNFDYNNETDHGCFQAIQATRFEELKRGWNFIEVYCHSLKSQ
jgi:hypothetical protein